MSSFVFECKSFIHGCSKCGLRYKCFCQYYKTEETQNVRNTRHSSLAAWVNVGHQKARTPHWDLFSEPSYPPSSCQKLKGSLILSNQIHWTLNACTLGLLITWFCGCVLFFAGTFVHKVCEREQEQGTCVSCEHGQTYTEHSNGMNRCLPCTHCRSGDHPLPPPTWSPIEQISFSRFLSFFYTLSFLFEMYQDVCNRSNSSNSHILFIQ